MSEPRSDPDRPDPSGKTEATETPPPPPAMPAAGPHAQPHLTNPDATPGAGSLPDTVQGGDADGGAG